MVENAKYLVSNGIKEIVLTGVNIGDYGIFDVNSNKRESNFLELMTHFNKINDLERIRISSIEPNLLNDDIIEFVTNSKKFVNHFHIPLQSGSDKILKVDEKKIFN